jgi:hypothetical protein
MKCELIGRSQIECESADRDVKYTIDLDENCPNGACNCADFMTRCQKEWDKTKTVVEYGNPQRTRCKHINAAVMFLGNTVIASFNK